MDKDLYEVLGVKKDSNESEIRRAYLKLAKKFHPDVNPGNSEAEQKFKEINLAYEVLKDEKKKAQYDQMRAMGANPFARAQAGATAGGFGAGPEAFDQFGLGDLFEEIFGGGSFKTAQRPRKGRDRESSLTVSFVEAARGGERLVQFSDGKRLTVKIPSGIQDGSKIKLSGQGELGLGGGPAGDLILSLKVTPHPHFFREGQQIHLKLPITFSEAVLGGEVSVPTLDGPVHLRIPAGISSGQKLKLAGKGIFSQQTGKKGDQLVEIQIKVPSPVPEEYKQAAASLQTGSFNPRSDLTI